MRVTVAGAGNKGGATTLGEPREIQGEGDTDRPTDLSFCMQKKYQKFN